jgi:hypothetical protein
MADNAKMQQFWRQIMARDSAIGRYSGPEQHDSRSIAISGTQTVSLLPFSLLRPIESIIVVLKMRVAVTVGAYADISADAPQNIVQRFVLRGNHSQFGSVVPWDISGASAFIYPRHFQRACGQCYISVGGAALTRQADPGVPFTNTFTGAVANHDIILVYHLPMGPILGGRSQSAKRQQSNYMAFARDYGDSLQLDIQLGDSSALGDATGATVAFTAFGSAAGSPTIQTLVNYGSPGPFEGASMPGVVIRNEQLLTNVTSAGSQLRLTQAQKQNTNAFILRAGTLETTLQTAGVTTFDTFDDTLLDRVQFLVDGKQIRRNDSNFAERGYLNRFQDTDPMQGHIVLSFIEANQVLTSYRGDDPKLKSSDMAIFADLVGVGANTRVQFIQEYVKGGLYPELR